MGQASGRPAPARCLLVLVGVTTGTVCLGALLLPDLAALGRTVRTGALDEAPFDVVLVQVCEVVICGCAAWLWLATTVVAVDASRGHPARRRGVPDSLRRWVLAAGGVALAGGLGGQAHADDAGTTLHGLPLPDRATTTTLVSRVFTRAEQNEQAPDRSLPRASVMVVEPGDTLWAIARASLPPHASETAVAGRVREIHHANRSVIGADPDLIRPRQQLRVPSRTPIREEHR